MGIIVKPLVTEKMTAITEKTNRFGFIVRPEAIESNVIYNELASFNLSKKVSWEIGLYPN